MGLVHERLTRAVLDRGFGRVHSRLASETDYCLQREKMTSGEMSRRKSSVFIEETGLPVRHYCLPKKLTSQTCTSDFPCPFDEEVVVAWGLAGHVNLVRYQRDDRPDSLAANCQPHLLQATLSSFKIGNCRGFLTQSLKTHLSCMMLVHGTPSIDWTGDLFLLGLN